MCGIVGFINLASKPEGAEERVRKMLDRVAHRGPDDQGVWLEGPITLGHRRLSVVDLSPHGHQPMISVSKRFVLVFNGEIYNHTALRHELEADGIRFRGHSDTEVLLNLIEQRGLIEALRRCIGMFALACWDRRDRKLQLARDRFGEKPLYYGWQRGQFLFGSELKALAAHEAFTREVDPDSVAQLVRFGYIQSPFSIYKNIFKLEPSTVLSLSFPVDATCLDASDRGREKQKYWSHEATLLRGIKNPYRGSYGDAVEELDVLLSDAVRQQMQADVPLGALLSGGIDSSIVVALMQAQSTRSVRTYSIGFEHAALNEAEHAKAVASHLDTQHTELYVTSADALSVIPRLSSMYDEPLGDPSQIPTYLVAKLAKADVTVALSGDGGDEIFCGYQKYALGQRYFDLPRNKALGRVLNWAAMLSSRIAPPDAKASVRMAPHKLQRLSRIATSDRPQDIAELVSAFCHDEQQLVPASHRRTSAFSFRRPREIELTYQPMAMLLDRESYLPDDVLSKVDRATMAVSLESRAPMLDHRISEFVAHLPFNFLVQGSVSKRILRDTLYRRVPRDLVDRPKAGFSIPLSDWLRADLHDWSVTLLDSSKGRPYVNIPRCQALLREHCAGYRDHSSVMWSVLSFLAWADEWL